MNRATAAAKVGMNHLRSLGFSAGRKKARSCHRITGEVATIPAHTDIWKRTAKASKGSMACSDAMPLAGFTGKNSAMGMSRN